MKTTTRPLQHSISRSAPQLALLLIPLALASFALLPQARAVDPPPDGGDWTWKEAGRLNTARYLHTATLLPNGMVLVAGGAGRNVNALASAELYDPASRTWTTTGRVDTARLYHTATLLQNGMVLVVGGTDTNSSASASAELYDPASGTWTATGSLNTARVHHTATLLHNGMVLVSGGYDNFELQTASAELYDPASGTWIPHAASTPHAVITRLRYYQTTGSLFREELTAISILPRALNCTAQRAGPGLPQASSALHVIRTRRRRYKTA